MAATVTLRTARLVGGMALVVGSLAEVRRRGVPRWEAALFRAVNGAPDTWRGPVRAVMQAGTLGTVPATAAVAALAGKRGLALRLLAGGMLAWFGAKALKPLGGRERPEQVLAGIRIRERIEGDLGWVSGHAAVSTALALTAADELPRWCRPLLAGVVATALFGRMYVGAHLPYDLVGGVGTGMAVAALFVETGWLATAGPPSVTSG